MVAHGNLPLYYHGMIEATTRTKYLGNDEIFPPLPAYDPFGGFAWLEEIFDSSALFDCSKSSNEPLTILLTEIFYITLSQFILG
ncbi:MAG: hypothetical protein ACFFFD_02720 [Promethearchaeota archaeon]